MKLVVGMTISGILLFASPAIAEESTISFYDVPCDQVVSGVLDCGDNSIAPIPAGENGSYNGVPLPPAGKVVTVQDGNGFTYQTGEFEATHINTLNPVEQLPDGTLTDAYYERLNRQYCEAKPWSC